MAKTKRLPWAFLDDFRGADFAGEWPTLPEVFAITTKRFGARPCFTDFEGEGGTKRTLSYEQAFERVRTLAAWLCAEGVEKGDRVAVTGKNSPEWATAYLAAMFAGATVCPIDYALSPAETENLLNAAQPKFLFVDEDAVAFCRARILDGGCVIRRQGKNWYCDSGGARITVNARSLTIITAHVVKQGTDSAPGRGKG